MRVCSTLVYMPVGPNTDLGFLLDTLDSVRKYALPDHAVLLGDDSGEGIGAKVQETRPEVGVLVTRNPGEGGRRSISGRFWETVCKGLVHSLEHYHYQILMRLDADALMIGPGADKAGIAFLDKNPEYGMIGSFRVRCDNEPRDFSGAAEIMELESGSRLLPKHRALSRSLNSLLDEAEKHGYELGEHIIAPGSMMSRKAAEDMGAHKLLGHHTFRSTRMGDDHVTCLMLRALGYQLGDFATGDKPLAIWLRNLQWSPEELVQKGKAIVHSVRGYKDLDEAQLRARFRTMRESVGA